MKVSVILPYFEPPIKGCIESIKNQTYKDIELISGSEKDFGLERKGAGWMRNFLAKKAKGEILFFMDADAILLPTTIEKLVKCFKTTGADAVSCLPVTPPRKKTNLLNYLLGLEYEERISSIEDGFVDVAATTGFGIKKKVFEDIGGFVTEFKRGVGEDWILSQELIKRGYKIWHSNKVKLYHYLAENLKKYLIKQAYHSGYRVIHFRRFKKLSDKYSSFLPSSIFLFNLPIVVKNFQKTKDLSVFLLMPLSFIRTIVWVFSALFVSLNIFKISKGE